MLKERHCKYLNFVQSKNLKSNATTHSQFKVYVTRAVCPVAKSAISPILISEVHDLIEIEGPGGIIYMINMCNDIASMPFQTRNMVSQSLWRVPFTEVTSSSKALHLLGARIVVVRQYQYLDVASGHNAQAENQFLAQKMNCLDLLSFKTVVKLIYITTGINKRVVIYIVTCYMTQSWGSSRTSRRNGCSTTKCKEMEDIIKSIMITM